MIWLNALPLILPFYVSARERWPWLWEDDGQGDIAW